MVGSVSFCSVISFFMLLMMSAQVSESFLAPKPSHLSAANYRLNSPFVITSLRSTVNVIEAEGSGSPCRIKVIGVGGGGGNAVNRMMESATGVLGVELWCVNTDAQALSRSLAPNRLNIGAMTSRGLGAGGSPDVGARAAEESREDIMNMVKGADLVFVTAGMGGGTGSGAAPIVAECAKQAGALTVGVVTKPFGFEGRKRFQQAQQAILNLKDRVDTLIVVSNDKLLQIVPENTPLTDAFLVADDILRQGVVGISEIIIKPGLVNVDFADVRSIMGNAGTALMGIGQGKGKTRAEDAALAAISSPLLDFPITRARGIVFNIVGGPDMTLQEINAAAEVIYANVDSDANIIFGALVDDKLTHGEVSITVLATGFATDFYDGTEVTNSNRNNFSPASSSSVSSSGNNNNNNNNANTMKINGVSVNYTPTKMRKSIPPAAMLGTTTNRYVPTISNSNLNAPLLTPTNRINKSKQDSLLFEEAESVVNERVAEAKEDPVEEDPEVVYEEAEESIYARDNDATLGTDNARFTGSVRYTGSPLPTSSSSGSSSKSGKKSVSRKAETGGGRRAGGGTENDDSSEDSNSRRNRINRNRNDDEDEDVEDRDGYVEDEDDEEEMEARRSRSTNGSKNKSKGNNNSSSKKKKKGGGGLWGFIRRLFGRGD